MNSRLDAIERSQEEIEAELQMFQRFACLSTFPASNERPGRQLAAQVHRRSWLPGMGLRMIVSRTVMENDHNMYDWFFKQSLRLPLSWGYVLTGRIRVLGLWPSRPMLCIKQQNIIPCDSVIIEACKNNDMSTIRKHFTTGQARPNDTTLESLTPVTCKYLPDRNNLIKFAIRAGNYAVVKMLLDNGADPNLTFGTRETWVYFSSWSLLLTFYSSPLNNAFLLRNADIIRLLLSARADLDYVNSRAWTSLSYLWDLEFENHSMTGKILDICFLQEFSEWNYKDTLGWGPIHRAVAFGNGRDIQNLICRGVSKDLCTTDRKWTPIHSAVMHGDESTFEILVEQIHLCKFIQMRDSAGWGLLHLAAEKGSEKMILKLLELGADPNAFTIPPSIAIPKGLEHKELQPETIAKHCGHRQTYDNAIEPFSPQVLTPRRLKYQVTRV